MQLPFVRQENVTCGAMETQEHGFAALDADLTLGFCMTSAWIFFTAGEVCGGYFPKPIIVLCSPFLLGDAWGPEGLKGI